MSRKRIPLNQNGCTADFRMSVPFEQNLQVGLNEATIKKYIQEQEKHDIAMDKLSVKEYEDPFKGVAGITSTLLRAATSQRR